MKSTKAQMFEAIGVAAVVLSLIFVAYQINQSNRIAKGTTSYELSRNWMEMNRLYVNNPEMLELRVKLENKDFMPADDLERQFAMAYARMLINMWTALEEAHENGLASDAYFEIAKEDVKSMMKHRPGIVQIFAMVFENYKLPDYEVLDPIRVELELRYR